MAALSTDASEYFDSDDIDVVCHQTPRRVFISFNRYRVRRLSLRECAMVSDYWDVRASRLNDAMLRAIAAMGTTDPGVRVWGGFPEAAAFSDRVHAVTGQRISCTRSRLAQREK